MIVIADSGSTKTEWALAEAPGDVRYVRTAGYNPYFSTEIPWKEELASWFRENRFDAGSVERVHYYGAGCDREEAQGKAGAVLRELFPRAVVSVEDDLTGAAKALYGKEKGVALILGTGTNAGIWDGTQITAKSMTVGFLLGDHGSGAVLGLRFVRAWFDNVLPEEVVSDFLKKTGLSRQKIKEKVYLEENPNYFLASFVPFLLEHLGVRAIREIVEDEFGRLFRVDLEPLCRKAGKKEVRATGSVAWHFREILEKTAREHDILLTRIIRYPLEELVSVHLDLPVH